MRSLVAAVILVLMTGCAAAPVAPPVPPTTAAEPTASETPAPDDGGFPVLPIDVGCAELLPADEVAAWFGRPAEREFGPAPVASLSQAASRAAGETTCSAIAASLGAGRPGYSAGVAVRPDTTGFDAFLRFSDDDPARFATSVGDRSNGGCNPYQPGWGCFASMITGGLWVEAWIVVPDEVAGDRAAAENRILSFLDRVQVELEDVAVSPVRWAAPVSARTGAAWCGDGIPPAAVGTAFGFAAPAGQGSDAAFAEWWTIRASDSSECRVTDADSTAQAVTVSIVPGADWIATGLARGDWLAGPAGAFEPQTIAGADPAVVACGADSCSVVLVSGGSALQITTEGMDRARTIAGIEALLAH